MGKYKVIDLFAGAGGLSLGFEQTKKFDIKVAFENNPKMRETYRMNHPDVEIQENVCDANYPEIEQKYGKIDVVIGGPPCQGFSNANRQKNHAISQNNMLVKQFIRAIVELQPKAFVMENVSMLKSEVHRFYMTNSDVEDVQAYHIPLRVSEIPLLDVGYEFDNAIELIKDCEKIKARLWIDSTYSELNVIYKIAGNPDKLAIALSKHKDRLLKIASSPYKNPQADYVLTVSNLAFHAVTQFYTGAINSSKLIELITPAVMLQRMLSKSLEILDNDLIVENYSTENGISVFVKSFAVYDYLKAILESDPNNYAITSQVLCAADYGAPQKRMRFVVTGIKQNISSKATLPQGSFDEDKYRTVRDAIGDLEDTVPFLQVADDKGIPMQTQHNVGELATLLRDSETLYNHITTQTTDVAMERFVKLQQGENFHALPVGMKTNTYSNVERTQNTIYLRLNYDEPSGTVVNVRKSMWIHPTQNRAISVREAARLQTFPDSFVFCGTKDSQYQQVGNAVPPIMAKSIAKKIAQVLSRSCLQDVKKQDI